MPREVSGTTLSQKHFIIQVSELDVPMFHLAGHRRAIALGQVSLLSFGLLSQKAGCNLALVLLMRMNGERGTQVATEPCRKGQLCGTFNLRVADLNARCFLSSRVMSRSEAICCNEARALCFIVL